MLQEAQRVSEMLLGLVRSSKPGVCESAMERAKGYAASLASAAAFLERDAAKNRGSGTNRHQRGAGLVGQVMHVFRSTVPEITTCLRCPPVPDKCYELTARWAAERERLQAVEPSCVRERPL
jgi:hypothetical protein